MIQKDDIRIALRVSGRVQGVGFRWFVVTEAERLGLRGWVQNTAQGDVELEAEGPAQVIREFRQRIAKGPPAARVERVDEIATSTIQLNGFVVMR